MRKITLTLQQKPPFCSNPRFAELEPERILCNDITLPFEPHPYGMRLWVIGNEYGPLGAVWASHEQDAFDQLCDSGLAAGLAIEESDADEETAHLGNAGEPHDLTHAWIAPVEWDLQRDCALLCLFAEARGVNADNLDCAHISTRYV